MGWAGHLSLRYRLDGDRSVVHDRHSGPLRILKSLYPETPRICHNVLVHPPGGVVGGDSLVVEATLAEGTHALLTTPAATRFYRSLGEAALQRIEVQVADDARLEWLPLETICHRDVQAENRMRFDLAPRAQMIGWDVLALGLPASGEVFDRGRFLQQIELPGVWLERGVIDGTDAALLDSPLGLAGRRVIATLWFAGGSALPPTLRESLLDGARDVATADPLAAWAGASSPDARFVVLRVLAPRVEPAMALLAAVWRRWREQAWGLSGDAPRVWRT